MDYNVSVSDAIEFANITPATGRSFLEGSSLSATSAGLFFDFSPTTPSEFEITDLTEEYRFCFSGNFGCGFPGGNEVVVLPEGAAIMEFLKKRI